MAVESSCTSTSSTGLLVDRDFVSLTDIGFTYLKTCPLTQAPTTILW